MKNDTDKTKEQLIDEIAEMRTRITELERSTSSHRKAGELPASEEKYRLSFESANMGMCLVDLTGNILQVNDKMAEIYGYSRQQLENMGVNDLAIPEDKDVSTQFIRKCIAGEIESGTFEKRYHHRDGHVITCIVSSSLIRNFEGEPAYFISQIADVTERKKTDIERQMIDKASRAVLTGKDFMSTAKEIFSYCKEVTGATAGYIALLNEETKEYDVLFVEAEGMYHNADPSLKMPPGDLRTQAYETGKVMYENQFPHTKWDNLLPEDHLKLNNILFSPLMIDDIAVGVIGLSNKVAGFTDDDVKIVSSLSEICSIALVASRNLELLKKSEETLRLAMEVTSDGIWDWDIKNDSVYFSPIWARIVGEEEVPSHCSSWIDRLHPEDKQSALEKVKEHVEGKTDQFRDEHRLRMKDGSWKLVLGRGRVVSRDGDGKPLRMIGTMTDISMRRMVRRELLLRAQLLDNASDGICLVNGEGEYVYVNEMYCRLHGYSREELVGKNIRDMDLTSTETWLGTVKRELQEKGSAVFESAHYRKDGSVIELEIHSSEINAGDENYSLNVERDITERKQVEKALRENEERFHQLFENMSSGVVVLDPVDNGNDFKFRNLNKASEKIENISRFELIGKKVSEAFPGIIAPDILEISRRVYKTGIPESYPVSEYKDERIADWRENYVYKLPTGEIVVIYDDITESKQVQEALHQSERNFRNSINDSPLGIVINKNMGETLYANRAALDLFGYENIEEMRNTPPSKRQLPENLPRFDKRWKSFIRGDFTSDNDSYYIMRKNGERRLIEAYFKKILWGGEECIQSIFHDITEQKEAEVLFQSIALNSPVGVYVVQNGKFVYTNSQFQKDTGYSEEELLGMESMSLVVPEDRDQVRRNAIEMLNNRRETPYEFRTTSKNGEKRWSLETVASIQYRGSRATIGSYQDITERKKIQDSLIVTDRLASVGELAAGIAHELNNPLTGVIGFSDLLLERDDIPEDIRSDLETINRESLRASQVARHLLTFARRHPDEKLPVDVNEVMQVVIDLREYEQKVSNITVTAELAPDLPEVLINDFQLQQVFINIIINAEFFVIEERGEGVISITTENNNGTVRISITDNGPGIAPENLSRIFDPFYTTKEVGKGTGLGLSICYGIITDCGGKIWAESTPGKGSSFIIELPAL